MEKNIKKILETLEKNGYKAYLVGGYVRDYLLGITSFDADIATNALPKDIHNMFNSNKSNYGSVNIKFGNYNIDITTFRKDLNYKNRRPSNVIYIDNLEEDLLRRDFTINAICMDKFGKIIDPLHGCNDLNNRCIKIIGDVDSKLQEDPLRLLRAIRFASILDFSLDENLFNKIKEYSSLVSTLSKDRVKSELEKILLNKNFQKGLSIMEETGISSVLGISYSHINYVDDLLGMWSQIKVANIPFTNVEKGNIIKITEIVNLGKIDNYSLYTYGLYPCTIAGKILNVDTKKISKMYNKLPIKSRSDINITSKDILDIYKDSKVISSIYKDLENKILCNNLNNKKDELLKYLRKRK